MFILVDDTARCVEAPTNIDLHWSVQSWEEVLGYVTHADSISEKLLHVFHENLWEIEVDLMDFPPMKIQSLVILKVNYTVFKIHPKSLIFASFQFY